MNVLTQYLDLYRENKSLVDSGSCPVLNVMRQEAFDILENCELPKKGAENYEITDLPALLAPDFGINLGRLNIDVNALAAFSCGVPNMTPALFFFRNDLYAEAKNARADFPESLFVGSIREFCEKYPEEAARHYGRLADIRNPLVALNTLLVQDGIVVWAREGVKYDRPIQIVGILENGLPLMALRRLLVIAEDNSEIKILDCDHTQTDNVAFLNLQVTEIYAGQNSSVEFVEMEESSETTTRLASTYIRQDKESRVSATGITLYNGVTRNEYRCSFSGPDATLNLYGMAIEDCKRSVDTFSIVEHTLPGCHTYELFKYVAEEEALAAFSGLIRVNKGASRTEAFQTNRNIISHDTARVYSKPTLEIYDDDVKCSHGSAIGQLDERQIFYMRSRGLTEEQACFLLKQAFMADVIESISMPDFRLRLHTLVERRFAGESHSCSSCKNLCHQDD